jgi:hypothetical protein
MGARSSDEMESSTPISSGRSYLAQLLPIYDEYLVAYRDRDAVPHGPAAIASSRGPVTFQHALVIDGQVAGTWRTSRHANGLEVRVTPMRRLTRPERRTVAAATGRCERFLSAPVAVTIDRR